MGELVRTLTVNFKIVTSAPGDDPLCEVIESVLKLMAVHPEISHGTYQSGAEFTFDYAAQPKKDMFVMLAHPDDPILHPVEIPAWRAQTKVTATYENFYA